MKTLLTTGCSLALLSGCTLPKVQETLGNEIVGAGVDAVIQNAPTNPTDITAWLYALATGVLGAGSVAASKYLKKKPADPLSAPTNVQVK